MERYVEIPPGHRVCRLGLATRGNTALPADAVVAAIDRGINYLNWCAHPDGMSEAIRGLSEARRRDVVIATQLYARSADDARRELDAILAELGTSYLDVITYFYLESEEEWLRATADDGAHTALREAQADGRLRAIGVTSHQRPLAAKIAASGEIDLLMIRYNAAHRGAEEDIFPTTDRCDMPVVAYTGVRWGALLKPTADDPPKFSPPAAADCYRFQLSHPSVAVALMAPDGVEELEENLGLLDAWNPLTEGESSRLRGHGDRVRRHAGAFP